LLWRDFSNGIACKIIATAFAQCVDKIVDKTNITQLFSSLLSNDFQRYYHMIPLNISFYHFSDNRKKLVSSRLFHVAYLGEVGILPYLSVPAFRESFGDCSIEASVI
jgi:hypothetical protein